MKQDEFEKIKKAISSLPHPNIGNALKATLGATKVGGFQFAFQGTEFDDINAALTELMAQPLMKSEYKRLSWIFGDI